MDGESQETMLCLKSIHSPTTDDSSIVLYIDLGDEGSRVCNVSDTVF